MDRQRYMNYFVRKDKKITYAIQKQEEWRQKQIDIYYRIGRPIFTPFNQFTS